MSFHFAICISKQHETYIPFLSCPQGVQLISMMQSLECGKPSSATVSKFNSDAPTVA